MTDARPSSSPSAASADELAKIVADADTGGRMPRSRPAQIVLFVVPLIWALFQLWYASPLPFQLRIGVFNATEARAIHLAFALFLVFAAYPATRNSPRDNVPWYEWGLGLLGRLLGLYLPFPGGPCAASGHSDDHGHRDRGRGHADAFGSGAALAGAGAANRGHPLSLLRLFRPVSTGSVCPSGASVTRAATQYWLTSEGVFGVALGVSTAFVFLFVLFGSLLEKAGAGNYFIKVAFAMLGHFRGGPAKAAVLGSAATGIILLRDPVCCRMAALRIQLLKPIQSLRVPIREEFRLQRCIFQAGGRYFLT